MPRQTPSKFELERFPRRTRPFALIEHLSNMIGQ